LAHDAEAAAIRKHKSAFAERFAHLTPREREVLEQIVAGRLNKEIASTLNTCERTIKARRAHIMEKLQAHSAAELKTIAEHWVTEKAGASAIGQGSGLPN